MHLSILKSFNPDILVEMLEAAHIFEQWNKLMYTADVLHNYVQLIYQERQYCKAKGVAIPCIKLERPLVYYFGFSQQMLGMAYQKLGKYEQAKESIYRYVELGWLEDLGKDGMKITKEFRLIAKANLYAVEILSGKTELLKEYTRFLSAYPKGLLPGLEAIIETALKYKVNVDELLRPFVDQIAVFDTENNDALLQSQYRSLCRLIAMYNKHKM